MLSMDKIGVCEREYVFSVCSRDDDVDKKPDILLRAACQQTAAFHLLTV